MDVYKPHSTTIGLWPLGHESECIGWPWPIAKDPFWQHQRNIFLFKNVDNLIIKISFFEIELLFVFLLGMCGCYL